jgi:hypothetical protein
MEAIVHAGTMSLRAIPLASGAQAVKAAPKVASIAVVTVMIAP